MHRPLPPLFFVGVFLLVVIAAVLMLAQVMTRHGEPATSTPRAALALQLALVQEGDAVGLRLTCVDAIRSAVTAEAVERARGIHAGRRLDEFVGTIETPTPEEHPPRRLVLRPDGTPLTRLLLVGGQWLAETAWFLEA